MQTTGKFTRGGKMVMIIKKKDSIELQAFNGAAFGLQRAANDNQPLDAERLLEEIEGAANDNYEEEELSGLGLTGLTCAEPQDEEGGIMRAPKSIPPPSLISRIPYRAGEDF